MAAKGAKGGGGDSLKNGKLPVIQLKRMPSSMKDSVAIAVTPQGDTIWRNTGSRSKGGVFYHPKDPSGKPKDRRYVEGDAKKQLQ